MYTEAQISLPAEELGTIFGEFDKNIKLIEKELHVTIISREDKIKIIGEEGPVNKTVFILQELSKVFGRDRLVVSQPGPGIEFIK